MFVWPVTVCLGVLVLPMGGQASAEGPDAEPSLFWTDELVITATRRPVPYKRWAVRCSSWAVWVAEF
jgi:hypothetical protein